VEYGAAQPVAVASIKLSDDERKRILKELQLDDDQLDAIPEKLDIARYNDDDVGDDVSGFLFNSLNVAQTPKLGTVSGPNFGFGKIPGGILVPL